jgi:predicted regulator of Ras-like GTPase activity (Roadblock/LC7/MglB family)
VRIPRDLSWLVTAFTERVPFVAHAAVASADGLPLAVSPSLGCERADQLAALTSGLTSLAQGAAWIFNGGTVSQMVVAMEHAMLIMMSVSDGSVLAVLAESECDMGLVAYEMTLLSDRAGTILSPQASSLLRQPPRGR